MLTYKKFTAYLLAIPICFFIYNAVIWKLVTEDLLTNRYSDGGDLSRLGYIPASKFQRTNSSDLPRRHLEDHEYKGEPVDVVTIGDSFSNGGGGGKNRYYQDYIASLNGLKVLNIEPYLEVNFISQISCYLANGYFDKLKPRILLLSSAEKLCVERFSPKIDFDMNMTMEQLAAYKRCGWCIRKGADQAPAAKNHFAFINEGNFKYLLYSIYYHFSDHAFYSMTYKAKLKTPLFSVKDSDTLLYVDDDVYRISRSGEDKIRSLNDNLNLLADKLAQKGIKLYFMPCADKYNMYSQFIINNKYPQSTFFERLRPLAKRYVLIDTKAILLPEIQKGSKDIYYADDTHWSWKAAEKIFTTVKFD